MTMKRLGTLKSVDIREVWKDEAKDFTPWLLNNSTELSLAVGLDLELHQAEHPVGKFSLDLIGLISGTQSRVIIENQLGVSDHSHFGQLLTYAGGTDAKYVIWIASKFREEYLSAIRWLNDGTTEDINFFAVEVSAVRIGDSVPAPLFKVVAQPNGWQKETRANTTAAISGERGKAQIEFWGQYLAEVGKTHPTWTSSTAGRPQHWFPMAGGTSGITYTVAFTGAQLKSEFVLDSTDVELNTRRYEFLQEHQSEIERTYGAELVWHFPEENKQAIIREAKPANFMEQDTWDEAIAWLMDRQDRLRKATQMYLQQLKKLDS
jgi:hypothetical protein